jgi:hypothetical protein
MGLNTVCYFCHFIIWGFTSRSRIFHLYGDITIAGDGLQNLSLCSVLRAFEQGGIFIVPHLLWHGTSVFLVSSEGPPNSFASYDTLCDVDELFKSGSLQVRHERGEKTYELKYACILSLFGVLILSHFSVWHHSTVAFDCIPSHFGVSLHRGLAQFIWVCRGHHTLESYTLYWLAETSPVIVCNNDIEISATSWKA